MQSKSHQLVIYKISNFLSSFEDKRYIFDEGIKTLSHGYEDIN